MMTRPYGQREPRLCYRYEPITRGRRGGSRYDHRSSLDETGLPSRLARLHPGIGRSEDVDLAPGRADRIVPTRLPPPRRGFARARADPHRNGVRHRARRSRTSQNDSKDRAPLASKRRGLLGQHANCTSFHLLLSPAILYLLLLFISMNLVTASRSADSLSLLAFGRHFPCHFNSTLPLVSWWVGSFAQSQRPHAIISCR